MSGSSATGPARVGQPVAEDLLAYLRRLLHLDERTVLRVVLRGRALGVFASPPFGVVAFRAFPVEAGEPVDATVLAGAVDVTDGVLSLPGPVPAPPWAGVLPPRGGWQPLGELPVAGLVERVGKGVRAFKEAGGALPPGPARARALDALADEVWAEPLLGPLTLRSAHAALRLGLLAPREGGDATVAVHRTWTRLDGRHGSVFARRPEAGGLRLA